MLQRKRRPGECTVACGGAEETRGRVRRCSGSNDLRHATRSYPRAPTPCPATATATARLARVPARPILPDHTRRAGPAWRARHAVPLPTRTAPPTRALPPAHPPRGHYRSGHSAPRSRRHVPRPPHVTRRRRHAASPRRRAPPARARRRRRHRCWRRCWRRRRPRRRSHRSHCRWPRRRYSASPWLGLGLRLGLGVMVGLGSGLGLVVRVRVSGQGQG